MKPVMRWLVLGLLAVGMAGGAAYYLRTREAPKPRYATVAVDRGKISARVTASGTLSALVTVLVGSQVSGRIASIAVDFNSPVKQGQVIATIESRMFRAAVDLNRANYLAAKANADKARALALDAERRYARARALGAESLVAQADIESAEANQSVARAQVAAADAEAQQALAALHQAQVNLDYTKIVSPIDGIVISRNIDVGQTVAASLQAPTLFTLAQDLTKMQVDTSVAESDVGKLTAGMMVSFTVDAYPGQRFEGNVRQIRDSATTVQNVVTYDAVIDVDNGKRLLKPGMTAAVTFTPAERVDVVRLPNAALRYRPESSPGAPLSPAAVRRRDKRTVYRLSAGTATPVQIQLGLTDGTMTEVVGGELRPGDLVVTELLFDPNAPPPKRPF